MFVLGTVKVGFEVVNIFANDHCLVTLKIDNLHLRLD